jgi:thioredoxin 1
MVDKITNIKEWQKQVIDSEQPVFVDFWAEWCGPCRMVLPLFEKLAEEYEGKIKFVKVNVDDLPEIANKYNVFSIPTMILFKKGELVSQRQGAAPQEALKTFLESVL